MPDAGDTAAKRGPCGAESGGGGDSEGMTFGLRPEGKDRRLSSRKVFRAENSKCKGPGVGTGSVCGTRHKEADVVGGD